ncbi:hypothetical protein C900_02330 [Fulvivirga imtechensis AK7]|uniref:Uncharacterized protein n=1 Tax=Fulvivirga imtechensis AK7 TaxID=1237149 RepID=L8JSD5_9BACT|nr:hypothetical protein [Fulvivirga imtechensis]ELR71745.1 hypothetical protein C900_02330 [Fulvivirga imtechensis AK7]
MYRSLKPPTLEMGKINAHSSSVKKAFEHINQTPICWLANEGLEEVFNGNRISDGLTFEVSDGRIVFVADRQEEPVATIHFDQQYVAFDPPKTKEESLMENESVRHNRQPIKYSFEYFKRKLTGAKLS